MHSMATKTIPRTKLTVRIWGHLFNLLEERVEACGFRRDTFLEKIIAHEVGLLGDELPQSNSDAARAHIEHHLKLRFKSGHKQMSLSMSADVADELASICEDKNVPREAFLNRLIMLLVAKPEFLDRYFFGLYGTGEGDSFRKDVAKDYGPNVELESGFAPLPMIAAVVADPFGLYRAMLEILSFKQGESYTLYGLQMNHPSLLGLNCYLPDDSVPGTPEFNAAESAAKEMEDLIGLHTTKE